MDWLNYVAAGLAALVLLLAAIEVHSALADPDLFDPGETLPLLFEEIEDEIAQERANDAS